MGRRENGNDTPMSLCDAQVSAPRHKQIDKPQPIDLNFLSKMRYGHIKRILIIHQGALGDFITCLPALGCLRRAFADIHMALMGYPRVLELVRNRYYADAVLPVDRAEVALLYRETGDYPNSLTEFLGTFQLIGVIGLNRYPFIRNLREISNARVVVIPPFPPDGEAVHMVDHLLSLPRHVGVPVHVESPRLVLSEEDRKGAADFLRHQGVVPDRPLIAVHPGSGSTAKAWPPARFIDLAEKLVSTYSAHILFVVGPGEENIKKKLLRPLGQKPPIILDSLPLPHLGAILARCRIFVGNDSGITHMAAAVGTPVVALFGPTDPVRWAPRGRDVGVIRGRVSCSPCDRETMSICTSRLCLTEISVDDVHQEVTRRIREGERLPRTVQHVGALDARSQAP